MGQPHKHRDLIRLWADGAEIEWVYATKGDGKKLWVVVDDPAWQESHEYRIKPKPKPDLKLNIALGFLEEPKLVIDEHFRFSNPYTTKGDEEYFYLNGYKYGVISQLKITLDAENNKVKEIKWD